MMRMSDEDRERLNAGRSNTPNQEKHWLRRYESQPGVISWGETTITLQGNNQLLIEVEGETVTTLWTDPARNIDEMLEMLANQQGWYPPFWGEYTEWLDEMYEGAWSGFTDSDSVLIVLPKAQIEIENVGFGAYPALRGKVYSNEEDAIIGEYKIDAADCNSDSAFTEMVSVLHHVADCIYY